MGRRGLEIAERWPAALEVPYSDRIDIEDEDRKTVEIMRQEDLQYKTPEWVFPSLFISSIFDELEGIIARLHPALVVELEDYEPIDLLKFEDAVTELLSPSPPPYSTVAQ